MTPQEMGQALLSEISKAAPDVSRIEELIAAGADVNVLSEGIRETTPLMAAVRLRHYDVARRLATVKGINLDARNCWCESALTMLAAQTPTEQVCDLMRFLIEKGANVNIRGPKFSTPLLIAADNGHAAAADVLLDASADCHISNIHGETPVIIAYLRGHARLAAHIERREEENFNRNRTKGIPSSRDLNAVTLKFRKGPEP